MGSIFKNIALKPINKSWNVGVDTRFRFIQDSDEKCNWSHHVCIDGLHRWFWGISLPIFAISSDLYIYSDRQFGTGCIGDYEFPAPQPYVLLSKCVIILGCLPFFSCDPKNVGQFPVREKKMFHSLDVQHRCFSLLPLGPQNAFSWLQWHMISM